MRSRPHTTATSLPMEAVEIDDEFWSSRLETVQTKTVFHQYEQLEQAGTLENFRRAGAGKTGGFDDPLFSDSDAYKWLEAASFAYANSEDPELRELIDEVVGLVAGAQDDDGYLNTYFTLVEPEARWENFSFMHELYCAGHLFEAAVAHYRATGSEDLLEVARAFADHIDRQFGPDGVNGIPGHEGIEHALIKLYWVTDEERYLDLAEFFIEARGQDPSPMELILENIEDLAGADFKHYDKRVADRAREHYLDEDGEYDGRYAQDHLPIREHETIEGHSVRATYFYTGAASLLQERPDEGVRNALERVWTNMTEKRMYVTGGIGVEGLDEGFTEDYDLPNDEAYAETCAAVGNVFWNNRMFELTGEAAYVDVLERSLYNGALVGISIDGERFSYVNPLKVDDDLEREEWFYVACCPTNIARLIASLEEYVYAVNDESFFVNLFVGSSATATVEGTDVGITQETEYPWSGTIELTLSTKEEEAAFGLNVRIPEWTDGVEVSVEGKTVDPTIENGYLLLDRTWSDGETVSVSFEMTVDVLTAHPNVDADVGRVALQRGPIVYCLEGADNETPLDFGRLASHDGIEATHEPDLLDGVTTLTLPGERTPTEDWEGELYRSVSDVEYDDDALRAIPYYAWGHREAGEMCVWCRD